MGKNYLAVIAFAVACVCVLLAAAALAGLAPLWLSVATVFVFAGPHNWAELRFFITRLPARPVLPNVNPLPGPKHHATAADRDR